jgi:cyclopropane fatty-acyl-phospholipid synthase-like methyltransferase
MTRSAPSLADFECTERRNELSCQHYDQHFDAVTTQSLTALLDAADVSKGRGRLDLFTGAALADGPSTERCAQAIGVDLSAAQVKLVREIHQKLRRFDSKATIQACSSGSRGADAASLPSIRSSADLQLLRSLVSS